MEDSGTEEPAVIEKRLVGTVLTTKPNPQSFFVSFGIVFLIGAISQFYWENPFGWSELFPAVRSQIFEDGEWWRAFSAILIHGDIGHYLSNMYMLSIFSFFIFGYFGFGIYPILTFFMAGIVNLLTVITYPPDVRLLGASGLVYLLGGFWLTMYFFIQRQYSVLNRSLRVLGIGLMIFFPTSFVPTTSYRAHAIGFGVGVLLGVIYFISKKDWLRSFEVYKTTVV